MTYSTREEQAVELARAFHEAYERLAPAHGYETREASAKPWEEVPEPNRGLMVAVARELLEKQVVRLVGRTRGGG